VSTTTRGEYEREPCRSWGQPGGAAERAASSHGVGWELASEHAVGAAPIMARDELALQYKAKNTGRMGRGGQFDAINACRAQADVEMRCA
jgi:hypothetical protein